MVVVLVAALVLKGVTATDAALAVLFLDLAGLGFALRVLLTRPTGARSRRLARSYLVTLVCLYLPFTWVVAVEPHLRWTWVKLWPALPGLIPGMFVAWNPARMRSEEEERIAMAVFSVVQMLLFSILGAGPRGVRIGSRVLLCAGSAFTSWVAYALYRM